MSPSDRTDKRQALKRAGSDIVALTAPVFEQLALIANAAQAMQLAEATATGALRAEDLEILERVSVAAIEQTELITGAGMAAISSEHPNAGTMSWWILRGPNITSKRHILNPGSDSYYDFSHSRWFQVPAERGVAMLIAPYVDSWGTDDLTVTAAHPLRAGGSSITTVVAADLDTRLYLRKVEDLLRPSSSAALVDGENRVVVSTLPDLETGIRLSTIKSVSVQDRVDLPVLGWSVVSLVSS
ncbi:MAG: hypothetical protein QOG80_1013 [Pseudonocardiales bacterium]|jgi:hypothetical protein|nr:hypothetical protein [Pseudonocardiales bacterium]